MATLKLLQFSGEIPRLMPRLLPDGAAQRAENVRLENGGLTPVRQARSVYTVPGMAAGTIRTVYKHIDTWLAWGLDVNACPGPVAQDRLYYTGDGVPKMRVAGVVYPLALPFPSAALTGTVSGTGSGLVTERLYVYTFVTDFGEESEPCPVSAIINWQAGQTVTLSGFQSPPGGRAISKQRIYRSQSSAIGTDLFFIAERAASAANFTDNIAPDLFAEVLPSRYWNSVPDALEGLTAGANGILAGFIGRTLYFCEPNRPHAWPQTYTLDFDYDIVALGSYGTTFVVMTEGLPYIVQGTHPDNMIQEKIERNLPCINARGVVDLGYGVAYPSKDGLVLVNSAGVQVATENLMSRTDWLLTAPSTFVAAQFNGRYFASYAYVDAVGQPVRGTFIIDLTGTTPFLMRASKRADALHYSVRDGALYMLFDTNIYEWDALGQVNEVMTWRSKQFVLNSPSSYGAILVEGQDTLSDADRAAVAQAKLDLIAANAAIFARPSIFGELNGAAIGVYAINGDALLHPDPLNYTAVYVFVDGELIASISTLNETVRLPAFRGRSFYVEVSGTAEVAQISMATSPRELNTI